MKSVHPALLLRPSRIPAEMDVNQEGVNKKNDIFIRNKVLA
jgi:hypothetical protein